MHRICAQIIVTLAAALAAMIILAAAILFLCAALYLALRGVTTPPLAALGTGGAALLGALIVLLSARLAMAPRKGRRRPGRDQARPASGEDRMAAALAGMLGEEFVALARQHAKETVLGSFLAGIAFGASPGLRALLRDLIKH